ncbi:MAG: hypothetical protein ACYSWS_08650 [Planctomycetota bacterium]|jgi:hypothetical protein
MNDSIQPIRYVPQINKPDPKGRVGDKKGGKDKNQDFKKNMSAKNKDVENKAQNQVNLESKNAEHHKQEVEDPMQKGNDHDLDESCGSILNTEV